MAGRYDFRDDESSSQYWQQQRGDINKKLADYLAQRQMFVNKMSSEAQAEEKKAQLERDTDWHSGVVQGGQMGAAVSGGNPYGAIIGAIIGGALGFGKSIKARKEAGQSTGQSVWRTLTDFFPSEHTMNMAQGASSSVGPMVQAWKQKQAAPMQLQRPVAQTPAASSYSPGKLQMDPELMRRFGGRGPSYTG